jgi:hypothetical protein
MILPPPVMQPCCGVGGGGGGRLGRFGYRGRSVLKASFAQPRQANRSSMRSPESVGASHLFLVLNVKSLDTARLPAASLDSTR